MKLLTFIIGFLATIGVAGAGDIEIVSDAVLDSIYAQGFDVSDTVIDNTIDFSQLPDNATVISFPEQMGMNGQVLITDNAQQNAFNPVNAANSAVSNVYNIFVIIESNWENVTVNLNNAIENVNGSNIVGSSY